MSLFLTPEQLTELTDRKLARDQRQWLSDHGYPFEVSAVGRPKVLRAWPELNVVGKSVA